MVMTRPLLWMSIAFMIGAAAGLYLPGSWSLRAIEAGTAATLCLAVLGLLKGCERLRNPALLMMLFVILGCMAARRAPDPTQTLSRITPYFSRPNTLFLGEIIGPAILHPDRLQLPLRLHRAFEEETLVPVQASVLLTVPLDTNAGPSLPWHHGDWVLVRCSLKRFQSFKNPGGFDYAASLARKGFHGRASLRDLPSMARVQPPPPVLRDAETTWPALSRRVDRFRQEAFFWLRHNLPPDAGGFYASLLLGARIPPVWRERLSRSGVIHLLSISGLHLGLASLGVFWLVCRAMRLLWPSRLMKRSDQDYAVGPALSVAAAYALVSGLALPTWRSLIMLVLLMGSAFFQRSSDGFSALGAAAFLIVLLMPQSLLEVSFQLSFLAMLGLFVVYPRLQDAMPILGRPPRETSLPRRVLQPFAQAFLASLAASILVMPAVIHHFHGISLAGFAANAILVPLVGFTVLPLGLASLGLFAIHEALALPFLKLGGLFLEGCLGLIRWFSDLSWGYLWMGTFSTPQTLAAYGFLAALLSSWTPRRKAMAGAVLVVLLGTEAAWERMHATETFRGALRITMIDVGQGTATLVRFPQGRTMLVDGGGFLDESYDVGRAVLLPYLRHERIARLDQVVLSHDHPDHRNGLRAVLSHLDVGEFWDAGLGETPSNSDSPAAIAMRRGIPLRTLVDLPREQWIDGCRLRILHPQAPLEKPSRGRDLNNMSLVLEIRHGQTLALLPGDIDQTVEGRLIPTLEPTGEVLLVAAHHGSETSNSDRFLEALSPRFILVSCGSDNPFGFPSERLLRWCRTHGTTCFRTDLQGAVEGVSDGNRWRVRTLFGS